MAERDLIAIELFGLAAYEDWRGLALLPDGGAEDGVVIVAWHAVEGERIVNEVWVQFNDGLALEEGLLDFFGVRQAVGDAAESLRDRAECAGLTRSAREVAQWSVDR